MNTISGAAGALKWISDKEAEGRREISRLENALTEALKNQTEKPNNLDGTDFDKAVETSRKNLDEAWKTQFKLLAQLANFDNKVDESKRDNSESITKADGENLVTMLVIHIRQALESFLTKSIPEIQECKSEAEAYNKVSPAFNLAMKEAVRNAVAETQLPVWVAETLEKQI